MFAMYLLSYTNLGLRGQEAALSGLVDHGGLHQVRLGLVGQVVVGVAPAAAAHGPGRAAWRPCQAPWHFYVDRPGPSERAEVYSNIILFLD